MKNKKPSKLWNKIGPFFTLIYIFGAACMFTGVIVWKANKDARIVEVKVCYHNKDTVIYAPRYCDITDTTDILKFKFGGQKMNIPFTSIETYTIK